VNINGKPLVSRIDRRLTILRVTPKDLVVLMIAYGVGSLVHFVHNAEFLAEYPNMPSWLSRADVYVVWLAITAIGIAGYILIGHGHRFVGLLLVAVYAALGLDSLGHYALAPMSAHTAAMNSTILLEVATAALLFVRSLGLIAAWQAAWTDRR
jgi:hypothetical protein